MAPVEQNPITVGIDVGQISDPTALCVCECEQRHTGRWREAGRERSSLDEVEDFRRAHSLMETQYMVRHIERLPLGTSYPTVARRIADILCSQLFVNRDVHVRIDVTGVGRPIYDDLCLEVETRPERPGAQIMPISFTSGQKYNRENGSLGKAFLVSRLQSLLQGTRIHAPDTAEVRAMLAELRIYEIRVSQDGHDSYGAFKVGKHDDLATALGLAVLEDPFDEANMVAPLDADLTCTLSNYTGW